MENKEQEMKKLDTEELDPVTGGADMPTSSDYHAYANKLREKYNIPQGQRIPRWFLTREELHTYFDLRRQASQEEHDEE